MKLKHWDAIEGVSIFFVIAGLEFPLCALINFLYTRNNKETLWFFVIIGLIIFVTFGIIYLLAGYKIIKKAKLFRYTFRHPNDVYYQTVRAENWEEAKRRLLKKRGSTGYLYEETDWCWQY